MNDPHLEELRHWMPPTDPGVLDVRAVTPSGQWVRCDFYDLTLESQDAYVAWIRSGRSFVLPDLVTKATPMISARPRQPEL